MNRFRSVGAVCMAAAALYATGSAGCAAGNAEGKRAAFERGDVSSGADLVLIRKDPRRYIEIVKTRCEELCEYTVLFVRQERLGFLVQTLTPAEHIRAKFRNEPFSVHFDWLDENSRFLEGTFAENLHNGRVLLKERKGLFGLPGAVLNLSVSDPVNLGQTRTPITDFGLLRMMERTVEEFKLADQHGGGSIHYAGVVRLEETGVSAHMFKLRSPEGPLFPHHKYELFVDVATGLPAGIRLLLDDGTLDMMYLYAELERAPGLTDEDFALKSEAPAGTQKAN